MASKFRRPAVRFTFGTLQKTTDFQQVNGKNDGGRDSGAPSPETTTPTIQPATARLLYNQQRLKFLSSINDVLHERAEHESSLNTLIILHDELKKKLYKKTEECISAKKGHLNDAKANTKYLENEKAQIIAQIDKINTHLKQHEAEHEQHTQNADEDIAEPITTPIKSIVKTIDKQPSRKADQKLAAARLLREVQQLRNRLAALERRLLAETRRKKQAEEELSILKAALSRQKGKRIDNK